ncbi:MAG: hypothetical protein ACOZJX_14440 [Pseudomonadota bacterium]
MTRRLVVRPLVAAWAGVACTVAASAAPLYRIEPLPANDELVPTRALAINNQGVIVGAGRPPRPDGGLGDYDKPFRYRDGVTTRLSLPDYPGAGVASTVNNRGAAAGQAYHALGWNLQGRRKPLARPPACDGSVFVGQINDVGQMAGAIDCLVPQVTTASLTEAGVTLELGTLPGDIESWATGINNAGQVAGTSMGVFPYLVHAFRWQAGVMQPLGTLGGAESEASAINAHGVVVGRSQRANWVWHPFIHDGVTMQALPTCSEATIWPLALNASAAVVGFEEGVRGGAVLIRKGRCHRLADLLDGSGAGWALTSAHGINDHGVIVGEGRFNGQSRAFVATPVAR